MILLANLTRDPEIRQTQSGMAIFSFSVAVNDRYKEQDHVSYIDCTSFGKTAETINQHFGKGDPILVEGKLKMDSWQDKQTGANRSKLGVTVDRFTFVGKSSGGQQQQQVQTFTQSPNYTPPPVPAPVPAPNFGQPNSNSLEDAPF